MPTTVLDAIGLAKSILDDARTSGVEKRVYFIQAVDGGPIKIGIAVDVRKRFTSLQSGSPKRLRVIADVPGDVQCESALHQAFADEREHGEWFHASERLVEFIREIAGVWSAQLRPEHREPGTSGVLVRDREVMAYHCHRCGGVVREGRKCDTCEDACIGCGFPLDEDDEPWFCDACAEDVNLDLGMCPYCYGEMERNPKERMCPQCYAEARAESEAMKAEEERDKHWWGGPQARNMTAFAFGPHQPIWDPALLEVQSPAKPQEEER